MHKWGLAVLTGIVTAGCAGDRVCTQNIEFGIWVHVNDGTTGAPINDALGQVRSGSYVDSLRNDGAGDGVYIAAAEAWGTFSMHLERPGYRSIDMDGIVVTGGDCHVDPTVLHVTLVAGP